MLGTIGQEHCDHRTSVFPRNGDRGVDDRHGYAAESDSTPKMARSDGRSPSNGHARSRVRGVQSWLAMPVTLAGAFMRPTKTRPKFRPPMKIEMRRKKLSSRPVGGLTNGTSKAATTAKRRHEELQAEERSLAAYG